MAGVAFSQGHGRVSLSQVVSCLFRIKYLRKLEGPDKRALIALLGEDEGIDKAMARLQQLEGDEDSEDEDDEHD